MRNIVCSNVHYFYYDAEFFFCRMREAGWTQAELYLGTPHIFIDGNVIDDFLKLPELADRYGVKITSVHPETISFRYNLCSPDARWNQKSVQAYRNCIDYAASLGAAGVNTGITGAFRDLDQSMIFRRTADNLKELALYAQQKGVFLTLETESPQYEGFITTLEQMAELDEHIGCDALRFGLNTDALAAAGETPEEWERRFPGRIRYLRFSSPEDLPAAEEQIRQTGSEEQEMIFFFSDDCYLDEPFEADRRLREAADGTD
ncbi:MAG: sugar phosphate isomerase/epimerase family protein [Emergencia sp.]